MAPDRPRLYSDLAGWYRLLTPPEEYADEAGVYARLLTEAAHGDVRDVLELGCGAGANASFLRERFSMTLTDRSPEMLALSRELNPDCEHVEGDMRTLRLGRVFDAVFVHDAIDYIVTEPDLAAVARTAFVHLRPGGVALFAPDHVREGFGTGSVEAGGSDGDDGRALRYLQWDRDPDPDDTEYLAEFVYVLQRPDGELEVIHDRHRCGLFPTATWLSVLDEAGFRVQERTTEIEDATAPVFLAVKPPG
jgi:SAM-dependent methyltransferase